MKKIKSLIKKNGGLLLGIIIGGIVFGGGVYAVAVASSSVTYSNSTSGLSATNVQAALDEIYEKIGKMMGHRAKMSVYLEAPAGCSSIDPTNKTACLNHCTSGSNCEKQAKIYYGTVEQYCKVYTSSKCLTWMSSSTKSSLCQDHCNGNTLCKETCISDTLLS